jgi:hypothetical protein
VGCGDKDVRPFRSMFSHRALHDPGFIKTQAERWVVQVGARLTLSPNFEGCELRKGMSFGQPADRELPHS